MANEPLGPSSWRLAAAQFGPVLLTTCISQVTSAVGVLCLPLLGGSLGDIYAVGLQLGFASFTGVAASVVYNLAIGRPDFSHWKISAYVGGFVALALALLVSAFAPGAGLQHSFAPQIIVLLFGLGGVALTVGGIAAVFLACMGDAVPFAGAAILPNVVLSISVPLIGLTTADSSLVGECLPAGLWSAACFATCMLLIRRARMLRVGTVGTVVGDAHDAPHDRQGSHMSALIVAVVTSTVAPLVLVAGTTRLPAGTASTLFLITRIATSVVGLGVNSLLLVRYRWDASDAPTFKRFIPIAAIGAGGSFAAGLAHLVLDRPYLGYGLAAVSLTLLLVPAAVLGRETNRRRYGRTLLFKGGVEVALIAAMLIIFWQHPSISGYFGVFMVSQALTIMICGHKLRESKMAAAGLAAGVGAIWLILQSW